MDVFDGVELLAEDGGADGFAGAVGHRAIPACDGDERAGFAFAPAGEAAGLDAHEEGVLAAVTDVAHLRNGQVKEINGFDFHSMMDGLMLRAGSLARKKISGTR